MALTNSSPENTKSHPILILHGWGSSSKSWEKTRQILESRGYAVHTPDMPGFGTNYPPQTAWAVDDYLNWVLDYIDTNMLGKVYLLGHSFGGRIAIKLAARHPEKLAGLMLVAAAGIKHQKTFWQKIVYYLSKLANALYIFSFIPAIRRFWRKAFYRFVVRRRDYYEADGVMRETFKKVISEDLSPYLKEINVPTIIIWGEKDKLTPIEDAYLINDDIKLSLLKILKNHGHAINLDAPEKLTETIFQFLRLQETANAQWLENS